MRAGPDVGKRKQGQRLSVATSAVTMETSLGSFHFSGTFPSLPLFLPFYAYNSSLLLSSKFFLFWHFWSSSSCPYCLLKVSHRGSEGGRAFSMEQLPTSGASCLHSCHRKFLPGGKEAGGKEGVVGTPFCCCPCYPSHQVSITGSGKGRVGTGPNHSSPQIP